MWCCAVGAHTLVGTSTVDVENVLFGIKSTFKKHLLLKTFLLKYFVFSFSVDRNSRGINSFHDSDFRIPKSPKHQVA